VSGSVWAFKSPTAQIQKHKKRNCFMGFRKKKLNLI
jgi:hypothetical protein